MSEAKQAELLAQRRAQFQHDQQNRPGFVSVSQLDPPLSPVAALADERWKGEAVVKVMVPRTLTLTLDDHSQVQIPQGLNDLPESLANHWYLSANGATVYSREAASDLEKARDEEAKAADALAMAQQRRRELELQDNTEKAFAAGRGETPASEAAASKAASDKASSEGAVGEAGATGAEAAAADSADDNSKRRPRPAAGA
jgi:hypothetical protein